jgi:integrase
VRVQVDGRRVTKRVAAPNTRAGRKEAEAVAERLAGALGVGDEGLSVAQLVDRYEALRSVNWSPSTRATFRFHAGPILEAFGSTAVADLRRTDIEDVYARWRAGGSSAATVRRRHTVLAAALRLAERRGVIAVSPARDVELDSVGRAAGERLRGFDEVLPAVLAIGHDRLRVAALLALATGARRGELVALEWSTVDLEGGEVRFVSSIAVGPGGVLVRKGTKGGAPKRVAVDAGTVALLEQWRAESPGRLVLSSPSDPGEPWAPGQVTLQWGRARRADERLAGVRFHDLRHLHATHLLGAGLDVATVAERLGHRSTRMTLDVYSHAIPARDRAAADAIGLAMGAPSPQLG